MKKIKIKDFPKLLKSTFEQWLDDKSLKLAASLSFYSVLSLVPLLVIVISTVGFFLGQEKAAESIVTQASEFIGDKGAVLLQNLSTYSFFTESGIIPTIISASILFLGALGVFIELKESLNMIWGIEVKPGRGLKLFFKNRLITFPFIFAIGFLLILALVISFLIGILNNYIESKFTGLSSILQYSDVFVSILTFTILFGLLFKFLPDVFIKWSYIWQGALFTSILFNIGKYLIGIYLGNTYYGNVYGTAGSLVLILIWIYYSSIIFFFGAEFTYVIRMKYAEEDLDIGKDFVQVKKTTQQVEDTIKNDSKA